MLATLARGGGRDTREGCLVDHRDECFHVQRNNEYLAEATGGLGVLVMLDTIISGLAQP